MPLTLLELNPQKTLQYGAVRRNGATPSGVVGVHTAENDIDLDGVDLGAENVARFILTRSDYGSYHDLVDADSILRLVPYIAEAWGAPAINNHGYHVSAAVRAGLWDTIPKPRRDNIVKNMAIAAVDYAEWLEEHYGIIIPARRLTKAEAEALKPGFVAHGDLDPGRRSDPGAKFDWDLFLQTFADLRGLKVGSDVKQPKPSKPKAPPVAQPPPSSATPEKTSRLPLSVDGVFGENTIIELQRALNKAGFYDGFIDGRVGTYTWTAYQNFLKSVGAYRGGVDGVFGKFTVEAEQVFLKAVGTYGGPIDLDRGLTTVRALQTALNKGLVKKSVIKVEVQEASSAYFVNPAVGRISSEWGTRIHPITKARGHHRGIDIANSTGTPIYAAFSGTVRFTFEGRYNSRTRRWEGNPVTGTWNTGKIIIIDGPGGGSELYGHLAKIYVRAGQKVNAGDIIGTMGSTGNVTGPHLHFEVWAGRNGSSNYNPRTVFNKYNVTPGKSKPTVGSGKIDFTIVKGGTSSSPDKKPKAPAKPKSQRVAGTERMITIDGDFGGFTKIALQQILHNRGYKGHLIDGDFGSASVRSMQEWLRKRGQTSVKADGVWGKHTTTALQQHLRSLGYNGHAIDGDFGPATITSLQRAMVAGKIN